MYNRKLAVEYAQKWALHRNPEYYDFEDLGGDCTNFVSQCLLAGGIEFSYQDYGWYYHTANSKSPSWTGVDEIFSFAINNTDFTGPKFDLITLGELEVGDIIQLYTDKLWTHTLIVSKFGLDKTMSNIYVCAHSQDSLDRVLSSYVFQKIRVCKVLN